MLVLARRSAALWRVNANVMSTDSISTFHLGPSNVMENTQQRKAADPGHESAKQR